MNKTLLLACIITTGLVAGFVANWQLVEGVKPTPQPEVIVLSGSARVDTLTCPDSTQVSANFRAVGLSYSEKDPTFGAFTGGISATDDSSQLTFTMHNGQINPNDFLLKGVVSFQSWCPPQSGSDIITISGTCGIGVPITIVTDSGISVALTGTALCI